MKPEDYVADLLAALRDLSDLEVAGLAYLHRCVVEQPKDVCPACGAPDSWHAWHDESGEHDDRPVSMWACDACGHTQHTLGPGDVADGWVQAIAETSPRLRIYHERLGRLAGAELVARRAMWRERQREMLVGRVEGWWSGSTLPDGDGPDCGA
ncbi:hypothetical protein [Nocardioides sp. KR10-350]|uniref:hypothetical protein n=1 Tax=Nocardioides cheoyonin TaxID=3156615 RepID=UPI0032B599BC